MQTYFSVLFLMRSKTLFQVLEFSSFLWSDCHLPKQLEAGDGSGGGKQPSSISLQLSNLGNGLRVPPGTLTIFPILSSFPVLCLPLHLPFVYSLPLLTLFSSVYTLSSQSLAADGSGVRGQGRFECGHASSFFFPSQTLPEPKPSLQVPESSVLCVTLSQLPAHLPLPRRNICVWGPRVIRGQVSTVQPLLPLTYFIPKYKTIEVKMFCIQVLQLFHLISRYNISFLVLSAHLRQCIQN